MTALRVTFDPADPTHARCGDADYVVTAEGSSVAVHRPDGAFVGWYSRIFYPHLAHAPTRQGRRVAWAIGRALDTRAP